MIKWRDGQKVTLFVVLKVSIVVKCEPVSGQFVLEIAGLKLRGMLKSPYACVRHHVERELSHLAWIPLISLYETSPATEGCPWMRNDEAGGR